MIHIPSSGNQKTPQVSQDKKNGEDTPFLGSPLSSIAAAVLWPLWLEKIVFVLRKTISLVVSRGCVPSVQSAALKCSNYSYSL